jgi:hypothetical protein
MENRKVKKPGSWVGVRGSTMVGFIVREYDSGDRYAVMFVYGTEHKTIDETFKLVESNELVDIEDPTMLKLLYANDEVLSKS